MPRYGLDSKDSVYLEVHLDGVKQFPVLWADTDEGFVVVYLTDPAPTSKFPERVKVRLDKDKNPMVETRWGKVDVKNKRTGEVLK